MDPLAQLEFDFLKLHQKVSENPQISFSNARECFINLKYEQAIEHYMSILKWFQVNHGKETKPDLPLLYSTIFNLADVFNIKGRYKDTALIISTALRWDLNPENKAVGKVILGEAFIKLGKTEKAASIFSEALMDHSMQAMWRIALYYVRNGTHLERAEAYAQKILLESHDPLLASQGHLILGRIHKSRGDVKAAKEYFINAYSLSHGDREIKKELEILGIYTISLPKIGKEEKVSAPLVKKDEEEIGSSLKKKEEMPASLIKKEEPIEHPLKEEKKEAIEPPLKEEGIPALLIKKDGEVPKPPLKEERKETIEPISKEEEKTINPLIKKEDEEEVVITIAKEEAVVNPLVEKEEKIADHHLRENKRITRPIKKEKNTGVQNRGQKTSRKHSKKEEDKYTILEDYITELMTEQEEHDSLSVLRASQVCEVPYGIATIDREELRKEKASFENTVVKLLLQINVLIPEMALEAIENIRDSEEPLIDYLLEDHYISEDEYLEALSQILQVKGIKEDEIKEQEKDTIKLLKLIPQDICEQNHVIPIREKKGVLVIATDNPWNTDRVKKLSSITDKKIEFMVATPMAIKNILSSISNISRKESDFKVYSDKERFDVKIEKRDIPKKDIDNKSESEASLKYKIIKESGIYPSSNKFLLDENTLNENAVEEEEDEIEKYEKKEESPQWVLPKSEAILIVSPKHENIKDIKLTQDITIVGRGEENPVYIPDPLLSRRHFQIVQSGEEFVIEDLNSSNGTWINGIQLRGKKVLCHGDRIQAGQNWFFFLVKEWSKGTASMPLGLAFVIMPSDAKYSIVWEAIYDTLSSISISLIRFSEEDVASRGLWPDVENIIRHSDFVIADFSEEKTNPSITFNVGIVYSMKKPVILISKNIKYIPSVLKSYPVCEYQISNLQPLKNKILKLATEYLAKAIVYK